MRRKTDISTTSAIGVAILILATAAFAISSGNLFAATHTSLAESGSSTT